MENLFGGKLPWGVAQLAEHRTLDPGVPGSSPGTPALNEVKRWLAV